MNAELYWTLVLAGLTLAGGWWLVQWAGTVWGRINVARELRDARLKGGSMTPARIREAWRHDLVRAFRWGPW